ncbi:MAG: oxidoreductase [Bacteroidales bacterium]|jgi:NAD(P)-dependent dehydrogenase (short-subunit alcohol dehydrogenase family)|nr:oxidoreductase [Bacteroidales bacterium]
MTKWDADRIGDLNGKRVIITGGASGIGYEAAVKLAAKGAEVILAVRTIDKGEKAATKIKDSHPDANVTVMHLDLGDLKSVRQFAEEFSVRFNNLDILINNAGVMVPPYRKTEQGFELQFGVNHLGHFALTGHLLPLLSATPGSRIVTVSSIAARKAKINFDNLDGSKGYNPMTFYRQSKLCNLLFAIELQNRINGSANGLISIACHPGVSATNLISRGSGKEAGWLVKQLMKLFIQSAEMGSLPTLYAATEPGLKGGEYIGPDGPNGTRGYPIVTDESKKLFKPDQAALLWKMSETLTGVKFPL